MSLVRLHGTNIDISEFTEKLDLLDDQIGGDNVLKQLLEPVENFTLGAKKLVNSFSLGLQSMLQDKNIQNNTKSTEHKGKINVSEKGYSISENSIGGSSESIRSSDNPMISEISMNITQSNCKAYIDNEQCSELIKNVDVFKKNNSEELIESVKKLRLVINNLGDQIMKSYEQQLNKLNDVIYVEVSKDMKELRDQQIRMLRDKLSKEEQLITKKYKDALKYIKLDSPIKVIVKINNISSKKEMRIIAIDTINKFFICDDQYKIRSHQLCYSNESKKKKQLGGEGEHVLM